MEETTVRRRLDIARAALKPLVSLPSCAPRRLALGRARRRRSEDEGLWAVRFASDGNLPFRLAVSR